MRNLVILSIVLSASLCLGDQQETDKAIVEVQQMMQKSDFQEKAAKNSKEAAEVANHIKKISGDPQTEQEIYKLAAEVLGNMKGKSPEEMQRLLEEAKNNPEKFYGSWSPEQKQKLKELSERLPAAQQKRP